MRSARARWALVWALGVGGCATTAPVTLPPPESSLQHLCERRDVAWQWDTISQILTLRKGGRTASVMIGSAVAVVDGEKITLSAPLRRQAGSVVVPPDFEGKVLDRLEPGMRPHPVRTRPLRIVVDPGHGGKDPGAVGRSGLREADVVLDIARILKERLEEMGFDVILTRDRDVFISLAERTEIASRSGADLFLSIHANASPARRAHGVEVYTLRRLTPKELSEAQRRKNLKLTVSALKMERGIPGLEAIVGDLLAARKETAGLDLAGFLAGGLSGAVRAPNRGIKRSGFYVLRNTWIPAVLVEVGFLTHSGEERRLKDPGYRRRIAEALAKSLEAYADWERETAAHRGL